MIALASRPARYARYMVAQKIAGRYLRDTVTVDNLFGLRAFPGPRGSEKNHGSNLPTDLLPRSRSPTYWPSKWLLLNQLSALSRQLSGNKIFAVPTEN